MKLVAHLLVNEFGVDEEWFESEHAMRAELKCAAKARARRMGQAGEQEFRKFCERMLKRTCLPRRLVSVAEAASVVEGNG